MKARINHKSSGVSNNLIRKRIQMISQNNGLTENIQSILTNLFDYMMNKQMYGCCHAFSSALFVALSEIGESPELCVGECFNPKEKPFDHSWIVLNGKIIDIAVYMPLTQKCNSVSGVVIMDIDTVTQAKYDTVYGYKTGLGFGVETEIVLNTQFVEYMNAYPFERNGLWTLVEYLLTDSQKFDIANAKYKYAETKRTVV